MVSKGSAGVWRPKPVRRPHRLTRFDPIAEGSGSAAKLTDASPHAVAVGDRVGNRRLIRQEAPAHDTAMRIAADAGPL